MIVLGIETSCDETAAAIVKDGKEILSNVVASSADMHVKTGGIVPENAARQQVESIIPVVNGAIKNSKLKIKNLDAIAVTTGPGLIGSLLVGVEAAKTLAYVWDKPIIPVNHLWGHIYSAWLNEVSSSKYQVSSNPKNKEEGGKSQRLMLQATSYKLPTFPAVVLIVSGGHTDLFVMKELGKVDWIGGTRDDAAGEAFDKTARILGLAYPGGPSIAKAAMECKMMNDELQMFPRPMIDSNDFDMSFSGLKTSVLNHVRKTENRKLKTDTPKLAAEVQEAIVDTLVAKTTKAVKKFKPKSLIVSGGVAANSRLREEFELKIKNSKLKIEFFVPAKKYCTDNAAMIAAAAYYIKKQVPWEEIDADPQFSLS